MCLMGTNKDSMGTTSWWSSPARRFYTDLWLVAAVAWWAVYAVGGGLRDTAGLFGWPILHGVVTGSLAVLALVWVRKTGGERDGLAHNMVHVATMSVIVGLLSGMAFLLFSWTPRWYLSILGVVTDMLLFFAPVTAGIAGLPPHKAAWRALGLSPHLWVWACWGGVTAIWVFRREWLDFAVYPSAGALLPALGQAAVSVAAVWLASRRFRPLTRDDMRRSTEGPPLLASVAGNVLLGATVAIAAAHATTLLPDAVMPWMVKHLSIPAVDVRWRVVFDGNWLWLAINVAIAALVVRFGRGPIAARLAGVLVFRLMALMMFPTWQILSESRIHIFYSLGIFLCIGAILGRLLIPRGRSAPSAIPIP